MKGVLSTFAADAPSQLDVLGHDRHLLGVDGAQVGFLHQPDHVSFARLLQQILNNIIINL